MEVEINESVKQAKWPGLEEAVRKASDLFSQVIPKSLQPLVRIDWERLEDAYGGEWVVVALSYDSRAEERELFRPLALLKVPFMRERFEWLWGRVLRTAFHSREDEPSIEDMVPASGEGGA